VLEGDTEARGALVTGAREVLAPGDRLEVMRF
jgi:hypothetical protein